jgi:ATP-dependent RNA helicase RhlE
MIPSKPSQAVFSPPVVLPVETGLPAAEIPSDSPFAALGLGPDLVRAIAQEGYAAPTAVQSQVVPYVLAGRDVLACAQTGTGKTAAFVLPLLQRLAGLPKDRGPRSIRVLVVTPTRELASQIDARVAAYGRFLGIQHTVVYGGVSQRGQEIALRRGPSVLVATPGRLLDLMRQGQVRLDSVTYLVLDEADRMLDMGFVRDIQAICAALPPVRQTLLFSATMPTSVGGFARSLLKDPIQVSVTPTASVAATVAQSVVFVERSSKRTLLERVLRQKEVLRALVFTSTKHGAERLAEQLTHAGIEAASIHGNKSQGARQRALEAFRRGAVHVLVATDVAARGIDVTGISHVVNFDLPNTAETYVHRIGRTGRAGADGEAISFCSPQERALLRDIERLVRHRLDVRNDIQPPVSEVRTPPPAPRRNPDPRRRGFSGASTVEIPVRDIVG